jgi:DNA-binding transcriptional LysR family regulator
VFPDVEVRHLRAVIVLAEELNFSRAAHRLHLTQSALSKQITEIEEQHRFHLFTRKNKKNVELTEVGGIFIEEARSALLHIDRAGQLGRAAHEFSKLLVHRFQPAHVRDLVLDNLVDNASPGNIEERDNSRQAWRGNDR